ncbi:hypothetical protein ACP275_03G007000 [Erythranthe tilingii]
MYLYNPVSQSIFDLPSFPISVPSKVILSSSPEEDSCRAIMSFGPQNRLHYCCPSRSNEWTPMGDLFHENVYEEGQKLLFCTNNSDYNFECWDLANPKRVWKTGCNERFPRQWKYLGAVGTPLSREA